MKSRRGAMDEVAAILIGAVVLLIVGTIVLTNGGLVFHRFEIR